MDKINKLICICIILFYILVWNMFLSGDMDDFRKYNKNKEQYNVELVKIEEVSSGYRSHVDMGFFFYNDNMGTCQQGKVELNYDEGVGDYIEVAFDEYRMYIRPIITISRRGVFDYAVLILFGIVLSKEFLKQYRMNTKKNI